MENIKISNQEKQVSPLLFFLFFFSGFSALIYQVAWQRALFTLLGSNIESTTTVVTVFMIGLGIGTLMGGWLSHRYSRYVLLLFAIIEVLTGGYGLMSISFIKSSAAINITSNLVTVFMAMALLLPPTLLMGASLPILTSFINKTYNNAGRSVAALYLYNTIGAAIASISTVFFLFEFLGLYGTVRCAALCNILIGSVTLFLRRRWS
jgi:spermidine synthase